MRATLHFLSLFFSRFSVFPGSKLTRLLLRCATPLCLIVTLTPPIRYPLFGANAYDGRGCEWLLSGAWRPASCVHLRHQGTAPSKCQVAPRIAPEVRT